MAARVTIDLYTRLLAVVDRRIRKATSHVGAWAVVTEINPVRVKFLGVGTAVRVSPAVGVTVSVGDRVAVDKRGRAHVVAYVISEAEE